jgi:hypothetical protein
VPQCPFDTFADSSPPTVRGHGEPVARASVLQNVQPTDGRYLARLDRTIACLAALYEVFDRAGMAKRLIDSGRIFYPQDAREKLLAIEDESQALVMTSPPYFDAVDYPRAHEEREVKYVIRLPANDNLERMRHTLICRHVARRKRGAQ